MNKYVAVLLLVVFNGAVALEKLNVAVYFESLCPDSYKFVKDQLQPNFKAIAPFVNLNLVPFGKSFSTENKTTFNCHHGPPECKGNKIISCALNKLQDQALQVEFTSCFMETFRLERNNDLEFGQKCASSVGLNPDSILDCYNSQEGLSHQLLAEEATAKIAPKFVPTIVYNESFDQKLLEASLVNFKAVVCDLLKKTRPDACQEVNPVIPL